MTMSQQRHIAVQRASIPYDLKFLPDQEFFFTSPQRQEEIFQTRYSKNISPNYLNSISTLFKEIVDACDLASDVKQIKISQSEVLRLTVEISTASVDLRLLAVRPCFEGHGMFTLVIYQLVKAARKNQIPHVKICNCCTKTTSVLKYLFGCAIQLDEKWSPLPTYVLSNLWELSASKLGLSEKLDFTEDVIWLNPAAFPTAAQLNHPGFVTTYYRLKYGANSMWQAGNLANYAGAAALEVEFQRTTGSEPGPHYIESINHMLAAFGRECDDKKLYEKRDLEKQTDTVFMHLCFLSKDDVTTVELKRIHVRPCFEGNHIITILIYQTIRFGLAINATRMVISCPKARQVAERKLGGTTFEKLLHLYYSTSSVALGISDAIADEEHTVLKLNPVAFPPASVLHHRRRRLIDVQMHMGC